MQAGFIFDPNKCTGCEACQLACTMENTLAIGRSWRRIDTYNPRRHPEVPLFHLSLACNHCVRPPCQAGCPAAAYRRDPETGALLLDAARCVGCRYCAWICPYEAPVFDPATGVMTKCTFCHPRLLQGRPPACVELCPTGALAFTTRSEPDTIEAVPGFPAGDAEPNLKILPLTRDGRPPELTSPAPTDDFTARDDLPTTCISCRTEWSLVGFSLLTAVLVGLWTATHLGTLQVAPLAFALTALAGLALSTLHLGQWRRAPRAAANLAHSWLSREVVLVTLFAGLASTVLVWVSQQGSNDPEAPLGPVRLAGWVVTGLGFLALAAIDQVYRDVQRADLPAWHSAGTLLTGLYLTGILGDLPLLAVVVGLLRLAQYITRKRSLRRRQEEWRPLFTILRIVLGFVIPAVVGLFIPGGPMQAAGTGDLSGAILAAGGLAAVLLGELIDRCEFYAELEVTTPARLMTLNLASRV